MILSPRGVEDILPAKTSQYQWIEKEASFLFSLYGYEEIRIPTFERTELFSRSVGEETDVGKQMYTFLDKKGRSLTLRPEATASVVRAYLQHKVYAQPGEWKVYYMGPMFRYERPQAARMREFRQIGVEVIGEVNPYLDVELIEMGAQFFKKVGAGDLSIQLNSIGCKKCRVPYEIKLTEYLKNNLGSLCSLCQKRSQYNPLRVLDCKRKSCQSILRKAPSTREYLCEDCQSHFKKVKMGLEDIGLKFELNPRLVRGLDYYTRTVFEFVSSLLGAQDTVCAGGRYDELVQELGGPPTPALGFAIGVERLLAILEKKGIEPPSKGSPLIYIATLDEESQIMGSRIAALFRSQGIRSWLNLSERSLSSQLKVAHKREIRWVMIIGEKEIKEKKFILRDMQSGEQEGIEWDKLRELGKKLK